jgi:hypothetical protein
MLEKSKLEDDLEARRTAKKLGKEALSTADSTENSENNGDQLNTV